MLVVVSVVVVLRGSHDNPSAPGCRLVAPPSGTATAADSSGLRIIDQGYSQIPARSSMISMGAVIQNTTDRVAYRTRVAFDVLGARNESLVYSLHRSWLVQEVPIILPGATVSVGDAVALSDEARADRKAVARISITPVVTQWLAAGDGKNGLAAVTAKVVRGSGRRAPDGSGFIDYTFESANCVPLVSRGTSLVFRDVTGRIVGGNLDTTRNHTVCGPRLAPGMAGSGLRTGTADAGLRTIPAAADLDRTDVTLYCDLAPPPVRTGQSGEPVNT
ncbi:hypothetical protein [Planosporangium mesophilum]|uniref:hypothetical protein n=1 Tax=Planosporangium mesophilum TaxID=689768 RepID=UPI001439312B|nr:hypothetical protein [Planosporangium mesophilum]NJC83380.1 hypothetical protein [Planosporangium mesophilum]